MTGIEDARAIVVHPGNGYIFFTSWHLQGMYYILQVHTYATFKENLSNCRKPMYLTNGSFTRFLKVREMGLTCCNFTFYILFYFSLRWKNWNERR